MYNSLRDIYFGDVTMRKRRKIKRTGGANGFVQFLAITIICTVLSGGAAYAWQSIEDKRTQKEEKPFSPSAQSSQVSQSSSEPENSDEVNSSQSESSSDEQSQSTSSQEQSQPSTENNDANVSETERVRTTYFDDAVFIGDSITTGISLYDILPNSTVLASTGINLQSILTSEVIQSGENKITILDALKETNANKIYIMLGANGLAFLGSEQTAKLYGNFVDEVIKVKPDAIIYVQSIFPIDEEKFSQKYQGELTNMEIDETNEMLLKMAKEKNVYYVNPSEVFKDENGSLMKEVTPDGLHFNSEYYTKWIDYLKTHALTQKN